MTGCRWILACVALSALAATGCSPLARSLGEQRLRDSGRYSLVSGLDLPAVDGPAGCGAQALAAVLAYDDPTCNPQQLAAALPWHDLGATPVDLLVEARGRGRVARITRGSFADLTALAESGRPGLVMIDAGIEVPTLTGPVPSTPLMHWAVTSGTADDGSSVLLAAPAARHHVVGRDEFLRRWAASDHCLIVVAPR